MTSERKKLQSKGSMVLSALFFLGSVAALAQSGGIFTTTGTMTTTRSAYTATLLPNGKVLIAGGIGRGVPPAPPRVPNAELYDPSTGTFSLTGAMVDTESSSAAVLLASGKVLIAHDITAEIYDPVTGTFSSTGNQARSAGTQQVALLADGRVILVICCTTEQLYDPIDAAFTLTGPMKNVYADGFASAMPATGKFLVSGGFLEEVNAASAGASLYDSATGTFAATGNMNTARYYHTATTLGDGTVLVTGGEVGTSSIIVTPSAEVYDPATDTFSPTGDMSMPRMNHNATLLLDGTVLITDGSMLNADIYHPAHPIPAPALFSLSGDGQGQGAIWHATTGLAASADNPAIAGEALSMYTTSLVEGGAIPPQVAVGGQLGEILYFGDAPGYPGYYQVNFRVPDGVSPGAAVPVHLTYLGRPSNEVGIATL